MTQTDLILASASKSRQNLLMRAGINFDIQVSPIDEDAVKSAVIGETDLVDIALVLAQSKALSVSEQNPGRLVIGADQTLLSGEQLFDKPKSREEARDQLLTLRGKKHRLETAVTICKDGSFLWSYSEPAYMTIRNFTPEFLGHYLSAEGESVKTSVGGYKIEGLGLQLFEKIDGDFFTILGLPMLSLMAFLREIDVLET